MYSAAMSWIKTNSKAIAAYEYFPNSHVLRILFHTRHLYEYHGIPHALFVAFQAARSKGRFFDQLIRGRYQSARLM